MFYEPRLKNHGLPHDPFKAIVAPRPIGWVAALSKSGALNLSPYSFFNAVSDHPHMVAFSSDGHKDAITFIEETGEFTCSIVTEALGRQMNLTSAPLPRGESEADFAGLAMAPSRLVKAPFVAAAPAALECRHTQTVPLVPADGGAARYFLVIGEVVGIHFDAAFLRDGRYDTLAARHLARGGYHDYTVAGHTVTMTRPPGGG
jgi:flavin reductase (DIM6/NTAB) family NADH-FMN oxidoreductase RutF